MRIAEFDRVLVLENAMQCFRAKGYAGTTMQELVAAIGLHPGSIYAAFGSKRGLLLAAVDHYVCQKRTRRRQILDQSSPLAGLEAYLNLVVEDTLSGACLVTRMLMEMSERDDEVAERMLQICQELEQDIYQALERAVARQELLQPSDITTLTAYLLVVIQGIITFAQCSKDKALLREVVPCAIRALRKV